MNNSIQKNYDVIIVGAGPCGVAAAHMLNQHKVKTLIVDKEKDILTIPRAVGMCEEGSRILNSVGLLDDMKHEFRLINRVNFQNKKNKALFHADTFDEINGHRMLRTFHQPDLERSARSALANCQYVDLITETELLDFTDNNNHISATLSKDGNQTISHARFLLACDGASSFIRKTMDIGFTGDTYPQDWMILDIDKNPVSSSEVIFSINPERPSVTLPGPGSRRRWEFVIKKDDNPETLFEEKNLQKLLEPWGDVKDMKISRKAIYTFHARTAKNYRKGNVFLVGDAAHITPPFAGQGMMAGLRDSHNLCWKIAGVIHNKLNPSILNSYESERIPQSQQVIKFAQLMGTIILPQNKVIAKLRDSIIGLLGAIGVHSEAKGIPLNKVPNHINGGFIKNLIISSTYKTGIEFPLEYLENNNGSSKLFDQHVDSKFYIIGWNCKPELHLDTSTLNRWRALSGNTLSIGNTSFNEKELIDTHDQYKSLFKSGKRFIVIRPDKMMVLNCSARTLNNQVSKYINSITCQHQAA